MLFIFFFNDTATTEIYTLSLHDALPICSCITRKRLTWISGRLKRCELLLEKARDSRLTVFGHARYGVEVCARFQGRVEGHAVRSEEHTSELQSRQYLVCRLLLEKKNPNS